MQIEITPKQYKDLIMMSGIAGSVFGMLGDCESSVDYKEQSLRMDALEAHLLEYAKEYGCDELAMDNVGVPRSRASSLRGKKNACPSDRILKFGIRILGDFCLAPPKAWLGVDLTPTIQLGLLGYLSYRFAVGK